MSHRDNLKQLEEVYRQVLRKMTLEWNKHVERVVSGSQAIILEKLESGGPQKASELAELLGITSGAVTGLSDKLISAEYAKRKRTESDRRVVYLEITAKGAEVLVWVRQQRSQIIEKFFNGLSDEDLQDLIRIFQQILKNIETAEVNKGWNISIENEK